MFSLQLSPAEIAPDDIEPAGHELPAQESHSFIWYRPTLGQSISRKIYSAKNVAQHTVPLPRLATNHSPPHSHSESSCPAESGQVGEPVHGLNGWPILMGFS